MSFWLYILLLTLHLAAMNIAGGVPIASAWWEWRERRGDPLAKSVADYLAQAALVSLLVGALLGLAIVGIRWSPQFVAVWSGPMSRKMYWGLGEIVFSLVLAGGYVIWRRSSATSTSGNLWRALLPLLSGTNLLYHFPFLFLVASRLADEGRSNGPSLNAPQFRQEMLLAETPAMAVHVMLASVAAAGITLLGLALRWQRRGVEESQLKGLITSAGRLALTPTVAQVLVGLWILVRMNSLTQSQLLGGDLLASGCFVSAIVLAFWLLQLLAALAFGETERSAMIKSMAIFLATIFLMTAAWHLARLPVPAAATSTANITPHDLRRAGEAE